MIQFLDLLLAGGILIYPLFLCAFMGTLIIFKKLVYWSKLTATFNSSEVETTYTYFAHKQFEEAKHVFENSKDPSLICLRHCIASKGRIQAQVLQSLAQQRLEYAKKYMRGLETVISVSPLLGILGTVIGIISSISVFSSNDAGLNSLDSQVMTAGLSKALITTALGLTISITGLVFYNLFNGKLDALKAKFERDLSAFESLTVK